MALALAASSSAWRAREAEVAERVLLVEQQAIEEGVLSVNAVAENDVRQFVRDHGGQAGFIGQHVDQAAAEHDGVADGERFQSRSQQHAAADFGLDVQVVGDLEVVHDGLENLVHFALGREQTEALEPVDDVIFRLAVPIALRHHGIDVVGGRGLVLDRRLRLDQDLAEFLLLRGVAEVVSPQAGLRLEGEPLGQGKVQVATLRCR